MNEYFEVTLKGCVKLIKKEDLYFSHLLKSSIKQLSILSLTVLKEINVVCLKKYCDSFSSIIFIEIRFI